MSERYEPIERGERQRAMEISSELWEMSDKLRWLYREMSGLMHEPYREVHETVKEACDELASASALLDSEVNARLREDYWAKQEKTPEV